MFKVKVRLGQNIRLDFSQGFNFLLTLGAPIQAQILCYWSRIY